MDIYFSKDDRNEATTENQEDSPDKSILLHTACSNKNIPLESVELIVKYDPASVKQKDIKGYYPLHVAMRDQRRDGNDDVVN